MKSKKPIRIHRSISHPSNSDIISYNSSRSTSNQMPSDMLSESNELRGDSSPDREPHIEVNRDELFDLIEGMQSRRLEEQRAPMPSLRRSYTTNGPQSLAGQNPRTDCPSNNAIAVPLNHNNFNNNNLRRVDEVDGRIHRQSRQMSLGASIHPDDDFFDLLIRCQSSRLEDQRTTLPSLFHSSEHNQHSNRGNSDADTPEHNNPQNETPLAHSSTIHEDEDFYSLLMSFQSARIEDQRSTLPSTDTDTKLSSNNSRKNSVADFDDSAKKISQV